MGPRDRSVDAGGARWLSGDVDSHIEHIFSKLGFTSRAQIAAWFSRQEQDPS
jgi:hypothetical protein